MNKQQRSSTRCCSLDKSCVQKESETEQTILYIIINKSATVVCTECTHTIVFVKDKREENVYFIYVAVLSSHNINVVGRIQKKT